MWRKPVPGCVVCSMKPKLHEVVVVQGADACVWIVSNPAAFTTKFSLVNRVISLIMGWSDGTHSCKSL